MAFEFLRKNAPKSPWCLCQTWTSLGHIFVFKSDPNLGSNPKQREPKARTASSTTADIYWLPALFQVSAKCFTNISSFHPSPNPVRWGISVIPFHRWRIKDSKKLDNLPMVAYLVGSRTSMVTRLEPWCLWDKQDMENGSFSKYLGRARCGPKLLKALKKPQGAMPTEILSPLGLIF